MDATRSRSTDLSALIERLQSTGVRLRADGDRLLYEAPPGAMSDELADAIRARKPELLAFLREVAPAATAAQLTIPPAPRQPAMPLSVAQQRLWFLYQLDHRGFTYNMPKAVRMRGPLDADALEQSLRDAIDRHESLRTSFEAVQGQPVQIVHARVPFHLERKDLSHLDADRQASEAGALAVEVARRPFDLATPPAIRACLVRLADADHVLIVVLHHILADGRSLEVLFAEIAASYGMHRAKMPAAPRPLPIQYVDYAVFERAWLARPEMEERVAWWRSYLAGAPPLLQLPTDRPRPPLQTFAGGTEHVTIPVELAARLRAVARERGASLYMTLAASMAALLSMFSGQDDISLGCPVENRHFPETTDLIGAFINTVVLRIPVDRRESFGALVDRVRDTAIEVYERQDVPFERLVEAVQPERNLSASPLFQVALSWLDARRGFPSLPGVVTEPLEFEFGRVKFDINLELYETGAEVHVAWFYNSTLFHAETMRRWIGQWMRLLDSAAGAPGVPLADLALMSRADLRLIDSWNATAAESPQTTVVDLFNAQVRQTPQAEAVRCGDRSMTYSELSAQANAVSAWLAAAGIGRGDIVALLMERSIEVVAAILGVLRSGAAYLPLDVATPPERQAFMLRDSNAAVVLVAGQRQMADAVESTTPVAAIEDMTDGGGARTTSVSPHDAAYVLYTSGSTGAPKAVVMEHRGLLHYVAWARKTYTNGQPLSFPLFTSLSFDLTVTSLFVPLLTGGRIVVYPEAGAIPAVFEVVRDKAVDVVKLTPAHLSMIADLPLRDTGIRTLIVGGEDLKRDLAQRIADAFDGAVEICNEYGPTETAVGCMLQRFDPADTGAASVPIGRPADNVRLYILDRFQQLAPIGAVGELHVAGAGVARGYLGRPDLTAERFLPDPFQAGARMYKTGDLARYRADGIIEYLGRTDRQIKIRGHRIELDEIAAVMSSHQGVLDCVVEVVEREESQTASAEAANCARCGLSSTYPGTRFDAAGVCDTCRSFEQFRHRVQAYFRTPDDLRALLAGARARRAGRYDCLALVSGGKDSIYMIARLKELGANVLAYTFDPGYLSEEAKANVRHVTELLGVDHQFGSTPHMPEIFADSLKRHANVCNGCFKALYTLSMAVAREQGIPAIVTGLSRGQLFETRLSKYYNNPDFDPDTLDAAVLQARKVYHRLDDVIARRLDVSMFRDDGVFDDIQVVDFYRYVDVSLREMLSYLEGIGWRRPSDTGRSTNCLINDTGIFVHKRRRGYHNYALPYSWDVRMGHKTRDEAVAELDDHIDEQRVRRILDEIQFTEPIDRGPKAEPAIVAYYVAANAVAPPIDDALRAYLSDRLPAPMVPSAFVAMDALPLTANGKIDRRALPRPRTLRVGSASADRVLPRTPFEKDLAAIWSRALGFDEIGVHDNFFALGGHSLMAAQVASSLLAELGVDVPLSVLFEKPTIAELSAAVSPRAVRRVETLDDILADIDLLSDDEARERLGR
jgi:amino acid adenylation domain-containing protein